MTLKSFLAYAGTRLQAHVDHPDFNALYLRHSRRPIEGKLRWVLDISQIAANEPGKGAFTLLLAQLQDFPYPIYVESVLSPRFAEHLLKIGFTRHDYDENSFYRLSKNHVCEATSFENM